MKANEIRLGNYILWQDGSNEFCRVLGVRNERKWDEWWIDWQDKDKQYCSSPMHEFEGIPLADELLKQFGFVNEMDETGDYCWSKNNVDMWSINTTFRYTQNQVQEIRFVHQLQNLYYALIGDELELP